MNKPVIIGAGIAGLSCANQLADHNITNTLIEADTIGKTKICGEFFSPESIPILNKWDIDNIEINLGNFYTPNYKFIFKFPKVCASFNRKVSEINLAERAKKNGTKIIENVFVKNIIPACNTNEPHQIFLSDGKIIETYTLIIATGKLPFLNQVQNKIKYTGIKAHFKNIPIPNELNMFLINGAYMGITNIDKETVNVCCLTKKDLFDQFNDTEKFLNLFKKNFPQLNDLFKNAEIQNHWLLADVPDFGKKKILNWPNTYFIGDAAATIFPATGNGLSMGLTSGIMAANHIILNNKDCFKTSWNIRYSQRLWYAKLLNFVFMNSSFAKTCFKISDRLPFFANLIYKLTRD